MPFTATITRARALRDALATRWGLARRVNGCVSPHRKVYPSLPQVCPCRDKVSDPRHSQGCLCAEHAARVFGNTL